MEDVQIRAIRSLYDRRFDEVSAAVLVALPQGGRIASVNVEAEELTGYERAELEAMCFADIFRDEDRQRIESIFAQPPSLHFRKLFEHNVIIQKRSKRKIVVDMGFRRTREGALVFTLQDITDIKNNEQRVIRANEYVSNIISSMTDILLVVDEKGRIQTANPAALESLEYTEAELVGSPFMDLFDPASGGEAIGYILANGQAADLEMDLFAKSGRTIPVILSASQMRGKKPSTVFIAVDISERKKAERLIAEQQMMIVQASKLSSLGEMASGIAHEINNPLHVISGQCELLGMQLAKDAPSAKDLQAGVAMIDRMVSRIDKIVRGLQAFSRDRGKDPMEDAPLKTILSETLALCEQRIRKRGVRLDLPEIDESLLLYCRPTQISQVLLNLLNNSFDAVEADADLPAGAWIKVGLSTAVAGRVALTVEDSGPGIKPEVVRSIFNPFFTTKPVGKGTGLGLSISRSIIEAHGGTLTYDATAPTTRFVVELPLSGEGIRAA